MAKRDQTITLTHAEASIVFFALDKELQELVERAAFGDPGATVRKLMACSSAIEKIKL